MRFRSSPWPLLGLLLVLANVLLISTAALARSQSPAPDDVAAKIEQIKATLKALDDERAMHVARIAVIDEGKAAILQLLQNVPKPPNPNPNPNPSDLTANAQAVKQLAASAGLSHALAGSLAAAYRAQAAAIRAGKYSTVQAAVNGTSAAVNAALGTNTQQVEPFRVQLRTFVGGQAAAGKLNTLADHAALWDDIAAGLEAV